MPIYYPPLASITFIEEAFPPPPFIVDSESLSMNYIEDFANATVIISDGESIAFNLVESLSVSQS